jgi:hypothetical protein
MNCPHPLRLTILGLTITAAAVAFAKADSLDLINGDHYQGKVVSMTQSNLEFQSEMLGRITLSREKVAHISLGDAAILTTPKPATNTLAQHVGPSLILEGKHNLSPAAAPQNDAVIQQMRQQGLDPKLVTQVQEQVFGQGNPAAAAKFNELMGGLMAGSLSVADIRAQAQDSIQQIKDAKQQLGPDVGDMFDGYLAILESFVAETATNTTVTASTPPPTPASTPTTGTP